MAGRIVSFFGKALKIRNKTPIEGAIQRLTAEFGTDISHLVPEPIREKAAAKADQLEYEILQQVIIEL